MGKVLGILALVFGLVSFGMTPIGYFAVPLFLRIILLIVTPTLVGAGIVCGILGIIKDDSAGLSIAGLIISSIAMINFFAGSFTSFWGLTY
jgi:membrane-bound ClpP family serine protease